jgi:hypothetical protein
MGSSAFEVIFIPVLWGTFYGIVAGMAILAVINAIEALVGRLGGTARPPEAVPRTARVAPRRTHRPAVPGRRTRGVYG